MTGSPGDGIGPEAGRLRLSHWAGPSVTRSAKLSQSFYRGIIIVILTKGKPVPLAWEFIYIGWGSHESDFHNITQNGPKICHRTVTGVTCDTSRCGARHCPPLRAQPMEAHKNKEKQKIHPESNSDKTYKSTHTNKTNT